MSKRNFSNSYQNYLLEQRNVEYLSVPKPMSATVSACLSLEKYFCSFSNETSCVISESHNAQRETRNKTERNVTDLVSGSPTTLYNKHQTEQLSTADCGLWTMNSGPHLREKNSSAHIVILKRFLKFAVAKIEMFNSSSLPLTPPCCEAWPPRLGNRGESPLKVTGMFVAFHRGRSCTF